MKIEWESRRSDGRFAIHATSEDYDATPSIQSLFLDKDPLIVQDELLSIASVLAFGEYTSGNLSLPRKVSPEVAIAIEEFLSPTWVSVSPINFEPRANSTGECVLVLTSELARWGKTPSQWGQPRNSTFVVLPSSEFTGFLYSPEGMMIGSNANMLAAFGAPEHFVRPYLAMALLFAETYHAKEVKLDSDLAKKVSPKEFARLKKLVASGKIALGLVDE